MNGKPVSILIADDDQDDIDLIEEALLAIDPMARLHKFNNGLSAYEYLSSRADGDLPCLIILDYNMPQLNGAQVLSSISIDSRYTPVPKVVLSTSNAALYRHESMINGATEYFEKPRSMADLHSLAKKLIAFCRISS